jgi:hypothetical protein
MRKLVLGTVFVAMTVGIPGLAFYAGHRLTYLRLRKQPWQVPPLVAQQVQRWQQNQTLAGAYALAGVPIDGVEACYYEAPDLSRVLWCGPDMPTPFVGYAPQPGQYPGGSITADQFRWDRKLHRPKPDGVCRIFLVGGSTAYGAGASCNARTIAGYLERYLAQAQAEPLPPMHPHGGSQASPPSARFDLRRFREVEVITLACSGWTSTHERIAIENRLWELEPDFVISLSGHNDAFFGSFGKNILWCRGFQDDHFCLLLHSLLHCNFDAGFPAEDPGREPGIAAETMARRLRHNVRLACTALEPTGASYVWALQPILAASRKPLTPRERRMAARADQARLLPIYDAFRSSLHTLSLDNFVFLDLTDVFDALDGHTDVFLDGCHFGDRGNDWIARALAQRLFGVSCPAGSPR